MTHKMNRRQILKTLTMLVLLLFAGIRTKAQNEHPWSGARVAIFGDSISDSNANNGNEKYYWYMSRDIGIIPYSYAENGRQWDRIPVQAGRLEKEHGQDFDAILILMGTNDFNAGVNVGEWYHEETVQVEAAAGEMKSMKTRQHRTLVFDNSTFKGRINIAMDLLKKMFPRKQIILMTPLHRGYANFAENNVQPDENYTNSCGEYVDAYIQAIKEAGNIWSVPVIDLNAISGLLPTMSEQAEYFPHDTDKLHPSDEGHARLAKVLEAQLRSIAPRTE